MMSREEGRRRDARVLRPVEARFLYMCRRLVRPRQTPATLKSFEKGNRDHPDQRTAVWRRIFSMSDCRSATFRPDHKQPDLHACSPATSGGSDRESSTHPEVHSVQPASSEGVDPEWGLRHSDPQDGPGVWCFEAVAGGR